MLDHGRKPDALEKGIRFGCGFAFAAMVAFGFVIDWMTGLSGTDAAIVVGVGIVCGLLAVRYGDAFWGVVALLFRRRL